MSANEVLYMGHCDGDTCDLGSAVFDCPICNERNVRYDDIWWDSRDVVRETGRFKCKCEACKAELIIIRQDYDYYIKNGQNE